jgi:hypothetical protein
VSQDSTCWCTGYGTSRIFCGPALPDANGVIATPAHYASGDNTNDAIHRMQRAISFQTVCVGRQESSASKNAKQVSMQASSPIGLDEKITTPPNDVHPVAPAIGVRTTGRAKGQRERVRIACGRGSTCKARMLTCSPLCSTVLQLDAKQLKVVAYPPATSSTRVSNINTPASGTPDSSGMAEIAAATTAVESSSGQRQA